MELNWQAVGDVIPVLASLVSYAPIEDAIDCDIFVGCLPNNTTCYTVAKLSTELTQ